MNTINHNFSDAVQSRIRPVMHYPGVMLLVAALSFLPSCEKGEEGLPGLAFVAFSWVTDEPDYIEIENEFIPAVFYWDWYYRVDPGTYYVYYEGEHRRSSGMEPYAWELEYEVWENPGKPGKYYWEEGPDGPDAYFTVELSPFGPEVYYEEVTAEKSAGTEETEAPLFQPGHEIIVEKQVKNFNLRLKYKMVTPRHNS